MGRNLLLLPLFLYSGLVLAQEAGQQRPTCLCVLVDISRSTQNPPMKEVFQRTFVEFLKNVRHGDTLTVAPISSWSEQELTPPVQERFPPLEAETTNLLRKRLLEAQAEERLRQRLKNIVSSFNKLLEKAHSAADQETVRRLQHTDIFGGLLLAERIFKTCPGKRHQLLILSDMIHEAEGINFDRDQLSSGYFAKIFATLAQEHRMPHLANVDVYVVGAHHPEPKRFRKIRDFWREYFEKTGARLVDYGSVPIGFDH